MSVAAPPALTSAANMGRRAGERFRETGVPSPNPLQGKGPDELAAAWRRAYFTACALPRTSTS